MSHSASMQSAVPEPIPRYGERVIGRFAIGFALEWHATRRQCPAGVHVNSCEHARGEPHALTVRGMLVAA